MSRSNIVIYVDVITVADEIRSNDIFNDLINELAASDEPLTDEGKEFIKKLAKQIEKMENDK